MPIGRISSDAHGYWMKYACATSQIGLGVLWCKAGNNHPVTVSLRARAREAATLLPRGCTCLRWLEAKRRRRSASKYLSILSTQGPVIGRTGHWRQTCFSYRLTLIINWGAPASMRYYVADRIWRRALPYAWPGYSRLRCPIELIEGLEWALEHRNLVFTS